VDLPKLHPIWEDTHRHFTTSGTNPPFVLHRRLRQNHFGGTDNEVQPYIIRNEDFLTLFGDDEFDDLSLEELDSFEKTL
jgi:hypothetical protein